MSNEVVFTRRAKAIAHEAFHQLLLPEDLGLFTDAQWQHLADQAEVPDATLIERADSVEYLRWLRGDRRNQLTRKRREGENDAG